MPGKATPSAPRSAGAPEAAVLAAACLWGTLWIPMRAVRGADGGSGLAALGALAPLAVLLPLALVRGRRRGLPGLREGLRVAAPAGLLLALGIALYAEGLARGRVARVLLLFYLMPVWSALLGRLLLGSPIGPRRLAALALALAGVAVVLGRGAGVPLPRTPADAMGLAAGLAWALAAVGLRHTGSGRVLDGVLAHFLFLGPFLALAALLPGAARAAPSPGPTLVWTLAFGLGWLLPVVALTAYGASRLAPARFALLLVLEVVVGLVSAALLAGEPLGPRELAGAALVTAAVVVEIRAGGEPDGKPEGRAARRSRAELDGKPEGRAARRSRAEPEA